MYVAILPREHSEVPSAQSESSNDAASLRRRRSAIVAIHYGRESETSQPMQRTVGTLSAQWDLHAWHSCTDTCACLTFSDRHAAAAWLSQFRSNPMWMAGLRAVGADRGSGRTSWSRMTDEQVIQELALRLKQGMIHVQRVPPRRTAWRTTEEVSGASETSFVPSRSSGFSSAPAVSAPKIVVDPDTFSSQTDAAATAAVLRSAALEGSPFCEECAQPATARKAA